MLQPAYDLSGTVTTRGGQCSTSPDFCFLCEYSEGSSPGSGVDIVGTIKDVAHALAREGKEISVVCRAMQQSYDQNARNLVNWQDPQTQIPVKGPAWALESIRRHLLYHSEYEQVFDGVVDNIFHSVIIRLNNETVDENGRVIEDTRHALMDTITRYQGWRKRVTK